MTVNAITVGPGRLSIGATASFTQFGSQVRSCTVTPDVTTGDALDVLSGEQAPGDRTEAWTLDATFLQDFGTATSTTEWLFEHRGEQHDFEYVPNNAAGKMITGTLTVEAIAIGGEVKTKPTSDVSFKLIGDPEITTLP